MEKIIPNIINEEIMNNFNKKDKIINSENDPRNNQNDGMRRYFPKFNEEFFSYEGEWKNGMKDGFGILSWDKSKFIGEFIEDKISGYGKLIVKNG